MTFTKQDKDTLKQNWDQIKTQITGQFAMQEGDLAGLSATSDPDQVVEKVATKTGQDREQVAQQLHSVVQQYSDKSQSQRQS